MTSEEFRAALKSLGWTQWQAAHHLGLSLRTILRYAGGQIAVKRPVALALNEALARAGRPRATRSES